MKALKSFLFCEILINKKKRIGQLEKAIKFKDQEIHDMNFELGTLKKIQRLHDKTILINDDDFYMNKVRIS